MDETLNPGESPYPTEYPLENTRFALQNHAGVFSRDSLDIGTRFFLDHIPSANHQQQIADLGCGNGVIGLVATELNPAAKLTFVDESFMAVDSARGNFARAFGKDRSASFLVGDGLETATPHSFDLVLNNPPFHSQRAVDQHAPWRMFTQALNALKSSGQLWVIGNRHLRHDLKLKKLFGRCETVAQNRKFAVLKAVKRESV